MKNLLIGSQALQYWSATFKAKPDADWDVISEHKITADTKRIEWHTFDQLGNYDLLNYASNHWIEISGQRVYVVNPIGLAIVKRSHLWRDRKFEKHMMQYNMHLKTYRQFFTDKDEEVLNKRIQLTMPAYPQEAGQTDVVFQVNWQCLAQDDTYQAVSAGAVSITYTAGSSFTPYADLTQDQVWGWVNPQINRPAIEGYDGVEWVKNLAISDVQKRYNVYLKFLYYLKTTL